ncbi:hypothetical protein ACMD2_06132 [Ananas comosus]|uniref:Uncharacterized protein n=1 Tax=Ananas comosus TaxID=4615 RepID=A0A199VKE5_ANACO|nr:hypothetical protein ACMD2_06132 [Ananas comosus]
MASRLALFLHVKDRRSGRGGPREAWGCCHGVWRHATLPSLPALILHPDTVISSRHHISCSGRRRRRFCHSTNPPTSPPPPPFLPRPSPLIPVDLICTFPIAYMLLAASSAFSPPTAATAVLRVAVRYGTLMGGDRKESERRADDTKHELELGGPAEGGRSGAAARPHGRPHIFAPEFVASAAAATATTAARGEHFLGDGDFEDGVQPIFFVEIRAQLPHRNVY